jgi:hypothetical protein
MTCDTAQATGEEALSRMGLLHDGGRLEKKSIKRAPSYHKQTNRHFQYIYKAASNQIIQNQVMKALVNK